jgi:hypothetical protein
MDGVSLKNIISDKLVKLYHDLNKASLESDLVYINYLNGCIDSYKEFYKLIEGKSWKESTG